MIWKEWYKKEWVGKQDFNGARLEKNLQICVIIAAHDVDSFSNS